MENDTVGRQLVSSLQPRTMSELKKSPMDEVNAQKLPQWAVCTFQGSWCLSLRRIGVKVNEQLRGRAKPINSVVSVPSA